MKSLALTSFLTFTITTTKAFSHDELGEILIKDVPSIKLKPDLVLYGFIRSIAAPVPDLWSKAEMFANEFNRPFAADLAILRDLAYSVQSVLAFDNDDESLPLSKSLATINELQSLRRSPKVFNDLLLSFQAMSSLLDSGLPIHNPYALAAQLPQVSLSLHLEDSIQQLEALKTYLFIKTIGLPDKSLSGDIFRSDYTLAPDWKPDREVTLIL